MIMTMAEQKDEVFVEERESFVKVLARKVINHCWTYGATIFSAYTFNMFSLIFYNQEIIMDC